MKETIEEPVIIKQMSVSLQHLRPKDRRQLKNSPFPMVVNPYSDPNFRRVKGFKVYVPGDKRRIGEVMNVAEEFKFSHEFTNILLLAQCHGCRHILFSTDGALYHDLPVFDRKAR